MDERNAKGLGQDEVSNPVEKPSTPTFPVPARPPSDTVDPIFENFDDTQPIDREVLESLRASGKMDRIAPGRQMGVQGIDSTRPKRKPGRPLKTDMINARAAATEINEEVHPDDLEALAIDLGDGKVAFETALKKELSRRVKVKGSLRQPGVIRYEYKFTKLVRKMVNLALAGDREMIKFCVERVASKMPVAAKEDRPTSIVVQNQIPTPVTGVEEKK